MCRISFCSEKYWGGEIFRHRQYSTVGLVKVFLAEIPACHIFKFIGAHTLGDLPHFPHPYITAQPDDRCEKDIIGEVPLDVFLLKCVNAFEILVVCLISESISMSGKYWSFPRISMQPWASAVLDLGSRPVLFRQPRTLNVCSFPTARWCFRTARSGVP